MNPETTKIIDRLVMSRDGLQKLDIADYAMIRDAREAMADAANALTNYAKTFLVIQETDQAAAPPASQTQPRETPADPDHMNLRGTCEDPRLKQAGYIVCGSNADREWHWKPPGGAWRDGHRSEEAAVNAALKHLAASQTQEP